LTAPRLQTRVDIARSAAAGPKFVKGGGTRENIILPLTWNKVLKRSVNSKAPPQIPAYCTLGVTECLSADYDRASFFSKDCGTPHSCGWGVILPPKVFHTDSFPPPPCFKVFRHGNASAFAARAGCFPGSPLKKPSSRGAL